MRQKLPFARSLHSLKTQRKAMLILSLEKIESRLKVCFWLYFASFAVVLIVRYSIFRSSIEEFRMVLLFAFLLPNVFAASFSSDAAFKQLHGYLKEKHPDMITIYYYSWTPMMTLNGMRTILYNSIDLGDPAVQPFREILRKRA